MTIYTDAEVATKAIRHGMVREGDEFKTLEFTKQAFNGAELVRCTFTECVFYDTILRNVNFAHSDLSGCVFVQADVESTNFYNTDLRDVEFGDIRLFRSHYLIDAGTDPRGYRFIGRWGRDGWMIKAGCRWFDIDSAISHWTRKYNNDALARVETIRSNTKLYRDMDRAGTAPKSEPSEPHGAGQRVEPNHGEPRGPSPYGSVSLQQAQDRQYAPRSDELRPAPRDDAPTARPYPTPRSE